jgi:hypothetical protein
MSDRKDQPTNETPDVSHVHTPGVAHEHSDVNVMSVVWFTLGLALLIGFTALLMGAMFGLFSTAEQRKEPPPTSLTREKKPETGNPEEMFPEPRLQQRPAQDLERFNADENDKVTTYGWLDPGSGIVRIPIEQAKKRLIERGLPYRKDASSTQPNGQSTPQGAGQTSIKTAPAQR